MQPSLRPCTRLLSCLVSLAVLLLFPAELAAAPHRTDGLPADLVSIGDAGIGLEADDERPATSTAEPRATEATARPTSSAKSSATDAPAVSAADARPATSTAEPTATEATAGHTPSAAPSAADAPVVSGAERSAFVATASAAPVPADAPADVGWAPVGAAAGDAGSASASAGGTGKSDSSLSHQMLVEAEVLGADLARTGVLAKLWGAPGAYVERALLERALPKDQRYPFLVFVALTFLTLICFFPLTPSCGDIWENSVNCAKSCVASLK